MAKTKKSYLRRWSEGGSAWVSVAAGETKGVHAAMLNEVGVTAVSAHREDTGVEVMVGGVGVAELAIVDTIEEEPNRRITGVFGDSKVVPGP